MFKDDLSYHKNATQSHTHRQDLVLFGAYRALDRDEKTCTRADDIGPNSSKKNVLWRVDLGGVFNIYSINILFRNYDGFGINLCSFIYYESKR